MEMHELFKEGLIKQYRKKKILVLASTFPRWANDTTPPFVFELEKRLTDIFKIIVLAPHFPGAKKNEKMENISIVRFQYFWPQALQKLCYEGGILPNLKKNKLLYIEAFTLLFFEFFTAVKIVKKEKIKLIHAHWIIPQGIIALLLFKIFAIPYIVTTHGGDIFGLQGGIFLFLKKAILKNARTITVVSNAIKQEIHTKIDKSLPVEVISMGVDSQLFNPDKFNTSLKKKYNPHGPLLLFVGRLAEKKGVKYLIQAIPLILKTFPTILLLIVGEGTIREELEILSKKQKTEKNIIFVGAIPNSELPKYYATADIFIGPSIQTDDGDSEGLGLTFVEASFSGCVPIGTTIGGISDVIRDKETGLLISPKNSQSIAQAVIWLLKNKNSMSAMKKKARESSLKKFDWKIIASQYAQLYS